MGRRTIVKLYSCVFFLVLLFAIINCRPSYWSKLHFQMNSKEVEKIELSLDSSMLLLELSAKSRFEFLKYEEYKIVIAISGDCVGSYKNYEVYTDSTIVLFNNKPMEQVEVLSDHNRFNEAKSNSHELTSNSFTIFYTYSCDPRDSFEYNEKGEVKDVNVSLILDGLIYKNNSSISIDTLHIIEEKVGGYTLPHKDI